MATFRLKRKAFGVVANAAKKVGKVAAGTAAVGLGTVAYAANKWDDAKWKALNGDIDKI